MTIELIQVNPLDPTHVEFLYTVCKEREAENKTNISFKVPNYQEHRDFVRSGPYRMWFLITEYGQKAGYVSLSNKNEIGIVLLKEFRHKGIGRVAVFTILKSVDPLPAIPGERAGHYIANINPSNKASRKMFESLGFEHIQETYKYG